MTAGKHLNDLYGKSDVKKSDSGPRLSPNTTKTPAEKRKAVQKKCRKPKDMPKRPLSAYNIFFREERAKMLGQISDTKLSPGVAGLYDSNQNHKPKVGFERLAKTIGQLWKTLPEAAVKRYKDLAKNDMERYRRETDTYQLELARKVRLQRETYGLWQADAIPSTASVSHPSGNTPGTIFTSLLNTSRDSSSISAISEATANRVFNIDKAVDPTHPLVNPISGVGWEDLERKLTNLKAQLLQSNISPRQFWAQTPATTRRVASASVIQPLTCGLSNRADYSNSLTESDRETERATTILSQVVAQLFQNQFFGGAEYQANRRLALNSLLDTSFIQQAPVAQSSIDTLQGLNHSGCQIIGGRGSVSSASVVGGISSSSIGALLQQELLLQLLREQQQQQ